MIKAFSQKTQSKVGQRRTLAHHKNHHSSQDMMPQIKTATTKPISMSISPEKTVIPKEPTIQSCKHLSDFASNKRAALSPVDSPFKNSVGKNTVGFKSLKPFSSAMKNATGTLERSLRKLNVAHRNISSTMSNDQITQVSSNISSDNEKAGDAKFDQIDFTSAHTLLNSRTSSGEYKGTPPRVKLTRPSEKMYKRWH